MNPLLKRVARWWLLVLVVIVTAAHFWVTSTVSSLMSDLQGSDKPRIKRMEAVYVSELKLSTPPVAAPAAAKPAPSSGAAAKPKRKRPPKPVDAASAPQEQASSVADAASEPEQKVATAEAASQPAPAASAADTPAQTQHAGEAFVWPKATRVNYKLHGYFRGDAWGKASVEWVREGSRYQVHVDAIVGPSFAPIGSWNLVSEGDITPKGLSPVRFEQVDRLLIKTSKPRTVTFEANEVVLDSGTRIPRVPGMQDLASQLIQLSYEFILNPSLLTEGNTIQMPLAMPKKPETMAYDVVGQEIMVSQKLGNIGVVHVKPRRLSDDKNGVLPGDIWFAPGLQYLPVRILFRGKENSYIEMEMESPPLQVGADKNGSSSPQY